ncbi:hypothetical protein [Aeromonas salmonicida]|uniref:hypothetical protein n=1 Tax=Aeromonas salmonicida TaxID=645 RepID=UPI0031FDFA47
MKTINTNVLLKSDGSLPIEIIQPTIDAWGVMLSNLPFIVTAIIVISAATVTYRSNRKSVENQSEQARRSRDAEHENKISEFRHHWLQEVRGAGADLCQVINEIQTLIANRNISDRNKSSAARKGDTASEEDFEAEILEIHSQLLVKRPQYYKCASKLKLCFKREEVQTKELFLIIKRINDSFYDFKTSSLDDSVIDNVISELQTILKSEWEITKERTWKKV